MKLSHEGLTANVHWDDQDPNNAGWYAVYFDHNGAIDDSMKVWHPEMPRRRNAKAKAERIAMRYLRRLAKTRAAEARKRAGVGEG